MATTVAFVVIVLGLCAGFVAAVRHAEPVWAGRAVAGTVAWLAVTGLASGTGLLEVASPVPPLMGFAAASMLVAVGLAASPVGRRLLQATPLIVLIGFQAFRVPLEVILHLWYEGGTMPIQMTWEGANVDVISGLLAFAYLAWAWFREPPTAVAWVVNLIGTALLFNVIRVALTSSPIPLRTYMNDPPVLLALHFPYGWIVPFCVAGALLGHLLTFRALMKR